MLSSVSMNNTAHHSTGRLNPSGKWEVDLGMDAQNKPASLISSNMCASRKTSRLKRIIMAERTSRLAAACCQNGLSATGPVDPLHAALLDRLRRAGLGAPGSEMMVPSGSPPANGLAPSFTQYTDVPDWQLGAGFLDQQMRDMICADLSLHDPYDHVAHSDCELFPIELSMSSPFSSPVPSIGGKESRKSPFDVQSQTSLPSVLEALPPALFNQTGYSKSTNSLNCYPDFLMPDFFPEIIDVEGANASYGLIEQLGQLRGKTSSPWHPWLPESPSVAAAVQDASSQLPEQAVVKSLESNKGPGKEAFWTENFNAFKTTDRIKQMAASTGQELVSESSTPTGVDADLVALDGPFLHSYCRQMITEDLNCGVIKLLEFLHAQQSLGQFQGSTSRRLVAGLREVSKVVRTGKAFAVVIAPDIEPVSAKGGLDDRIRALLAAAEDTNTLVIFALSRKRLGQIFGSRKKMSTVAILDYRGAESLFKLVTCNTLKAQEQYRQELVKCNGPLNCPEHLTQMFTPSMDATQENCGPWPAHTATANVENLLCGELFQHMRSLDTQGSNIQSLYPYAASSGAQWPNDMLNQRSPAIMPSDAVHKILLNCCSLPAAARTRYNSSVW